MNKTITDKSITSCTPIPRGSVYIMPVTEEQFQSSMVEIYRQVESSRVEDEKNYKRLINPQP